MDFLQRLLDHYQMSESDYHAWTRPLTVLDLPSPSVFDELDKAVSRIKKAIDGNEKIVIYGDYDCDGVMSTSIMVKTFALLGVNVGYYLPSRYLDGYGLNVTKTKEMAEKGYSLIITVDNGISAFEAIQLANDLHVDVIVTDHHEAGATLPSAYAILHPVVKSQSPSYSCGAYVAFMLSIALLGRVDDYLLSLAGIATISDMMPLVGVNRDVVRLAIETINRNKYPQLSVLAESADIDEKTIGMAIAPKINAVGRMVENNTINRLVKFFISQDMSEINELASWLSAINLERRSLMKEASQNHADVTSEESAIVLLTSEKEGLIGLLANRLLNMHHKPIVVFTQSLDNPELLKGSARSEEGFNIAKAFQSLERFMQTSGGHGLAGGLSIKKQDFAEFKAAFLELAKEFPIEKKQPKTLEISLADVTWEHYGLIRSLSPFGQDFPAPKFLIKGLKTATFSYLSMDHHISTNIGMDTRLLGFNFPKKDVSEFKYVDLVGEFETNTFKGRKYLNFRIGSLTRSER